MVESDFGDHREALSILVVEDDRSLQKLLKMPLEQLTDDLTVVGTAAAELEQLSQRTFSALAYDVGLPDRSGLEVVELAREGHPTMGIVTITGMADVQTAVGTMKAGGDDFLTNPFNPAMLWHVIQKAVEGRQRRVEADQAAIYQKLAFTNCPNRRFVEEQLAREIEASKFTQEPLTIAYLDIDNFKLFNDFLGHVQGDRILCEVADRLRRCVHAPASFGRFGGDEFVLILPNLSAPEIHQAMARIRSELVGIDMSSESNLSLVTQVSVGLSTHQPGSSPRELVAKKTPCTWISPVQRSETAWPTSARGRLTSVTSGRFATL